MPDKMPAMHFNSGHFLGCYHRQREAHKLAEIMETSVGYVERP